MCIDLLCSGARLHSHRRFDKVDDPLTVPAALLVEELPPYGLCHDGPRHCLWHRIGDDRHLPMYTDKRRLVEMGRRKC